MAENFDGVWELRVFYSTTPVGEELMQHRLTFDINVTNSPVPGTEFTDVQLTKKGGAAVALSSWLTAELMPLLDDCFPNTTDFILAELWQIPEGTYNGTFIGAMALGVSGTNATASTVAHQTTFTFRSQFGGTARFQLMESSFSGSLKQTAPFSNATANALTNFLIGANSVVRARDNGFLIARIHQSDGQNEKLWRKRFRDN